MITNTNSPDRALGPTIDPCKAHHKLESVVKLNMEDPVPPLQFAKNRAAPRSPLRNAVLHIRDGLIAIKLFYLRKIMKMDLHPNVKISLKSNLDLTNPRGVHVGEGTYIAFHAVILAHDMSRVMHTDTYVGRNCFIGAYSIIMPGVRVGDECIIGSGSVVTKDVPSHSIVAGNPAKVVRAGIRTIKWGILEDSYNEALSAELKSQSKFFFD